MGTIYAEFGKFVISVKKEAFFGHLKGNLSQKRKRLLWVFHIQDSWQNDFYLSNPKVQAAGTVPATFLLFFFVSELLTQIIQLLQSLS